MKKDKPYPIQKPEEEWLETLGEEKFSILRKGGTERPFSGEYNTHFQNGTYSCGACHASLFTSHSKFDSGCGWPAFDQAIPGAVEYKKDTSFGMLRTEIRCTNCGSHLGHVFPDGPTETGQRYCVNSKSMDFKTL